MSAFSDIFDVEQMLLWFGLMIAGLLFVCFFISRFGPPLEQSPGTASHSVPLADLSRQSALLTAEVTRAQVRPSVTVNTCPNPQGVPLIRPAAFGRAHHLCAFIPGSLRHSTQPAALRRGAVPASPGSEPADTADPQLLLPF